MDKKVLTFRPKIKVCFMLLATGSKVDYDTFRVVMDEGAHQTEQMQRLVYAFVRYIYLRQVFLHHSLHVY